MADSDVAAADLDDGEADDDDGNRIIMIKKMLLQKLIRGGLSTA